MSPAQEALLELVHSARHVQRIMAECVRETLAALASDEPAQSAAPEPLLTSRAAAHVGHYWPL